MQFFKKKDMESLSKIYPYSMDDMMGLDIDILLRQPNVIVLHEGGKDCDSFIDRILKSGKRDLPPESKFYLVQAITGTFVMHNREAGFYNDGAAGAKEVYNETQRRLVLLERYAKKHPDSFERVFIGPPIYLLLDCFTLLRRAQYKDIFSNLIHIMTCARQTNTHIIAFDKPIVFQSSDSSFFSSIAVLRAGYTDKFRDLVPGEFRNIQEGHFYFSPHYGEDGIYKI